MEAKAKEQLLLAYIEAYNRFDIDNMIANLDADVTFQNITANVVNVTIRGVDAFRQQAEAAVALFTERKQTAISFKHSGEQTEVPIDYYAVLAVDLHNGFKKGDVLRMQGKSIFTFKENKISGITDIS